MKPVVTSQGLSIGTYIRYKTVGIDDIFVIDGLDDTRTENNIHISSIEEYGVWITFDPACMFLVEREELEEHYKAKAANWVARERIRVGTPVRLVRLGVGYKAFGGPSPVLEEILSYKGKEGEIVALPKDSYNITVRFNEDGKEFDVSYFCLNRIRDREAEIGDIVSLDGLVGAKVKDVQVITDLGGKLYTYTLEYVTRDPIMVKEG